VLTSIDRVGPADLGDLLPMLRAYCDFYGVDPADDALSALCGALIDAPDEGEQLIARISSGAAPGSDVAAPAAPVGFATIYWTWQTLDAARVGVLNDLYVAPQARGAGVGRALIERCLRRCRDRGVAKLVWETAPDNVTAQRLYDGIGARWSLWRSYEIETR
jgi:ribosomal protein S18 acetylase RimI-like enzyme